jgi:hypothetical protein
MSAAVSWRKTILLNRSVVISAFGRAFPRHDFATLRLSRTTHGSHWDDEAWARAARAYHEDRKQKERMR